MPKDIRTSPFWIDLLKKVIQIAFKGLLKPKAKSHHQHVVPYQGEWAVRGEGNSRISGRFIYQDDAIARAKEIAHSHGADIIIHRKDGTIRDRLKA